MEKNKIIKYWIDSSEVDYKAMKHLFEKGDYHWSLFMGHLVLEKLLKAYYVKSKDKQPPFIHNLTRIAILADIELTEKQFDILDTVTTFNIRARYDDYKNQFYKKCTYEYSKTWINNIEEIIQWLKKKLLK